MRFLKFLSFSILIGIVVGCSPKSDSSANSDRPLDYWVFRSVLDWNPRMVTLALSDDLWLSYFTESGGLYKAWKGGVNFDGPVYTKVHGPQPTTVGNSYIENKYRSPWFVLRGRDSISVDFRYAGHRFVDGKVQLMYELFPVNTPKNPIKIYEQVEVGHQNGGVVFEREFITENVPDGLTVGLRINLNSIEEEDKVSSDGNWTITHSDSYSYYKKNYLNLDGTLMLNSNAKTAFNTQFSIPTLENKGDENIVKSTEDEEGVHVGLTAINKSDCKTCHNKTRETVGPSYVAIANKYENTDDNIQLLSAKIRNGGFGIWGQQAMTPHPDLSDETLADMVEYIMTLKEEDDKKTIVSKKFDLAPDDTVNPDNFLPGAVVKIYSIPDSTTLMPRYFEGKNPNQAGVLSAFDHLSGGDFKDLDDYFAMTSTGYLKIDEAGSYGFHIWSDDGSLLYINDGLVIDNDGLHGAEYGEAIIEMKEGYYKFQLDYFQSAGGKYLSFNWKKPGDTEYQSVPDSHIFHENNTESLLKDYKLPMANVSKIPGDAFPLTEVHPSFDLFQARPNDFHPMVGGMDFMSDGSLIVSVWEPSGSVYRVTNVQSKDPSKIKYERIAFGLAEPLGLKVVNDTIYVMQKQEMTRLIDNDGDGIIDEYRTLCDGWRVSANFHEFGFGLAYKDGYFYATLATAINPGGASTQPQIPDRGKVVKVNKNTGEMSFIASGLRTPNGIGIGYNGEIFVADNQGDWLPSSKIVHVTDGAWFGSRSVDFEGTEGKKESLPVVWLPQDEIGNSPSTPLAFNHGPYKGQMIHGEVTHGGIKRVFVEEIDGELQGCVFRFIQGLEAGVNRIAWGPNDDLYVGGIGNPGNWGQSGKYYYGLQRLVYNGKSTFEMLAVRAKTGGLEIEFTEPLEPGDGWNKDFYEVKQWYYKPTERYGGPKIDEKYLNVRSATVSENRKKVFLEINGIQENHVVYLRLKKHFISEPGNQLWTTEAWYTMNHIPKGSQGIVRKPKFTTVDNVLSPAEVQAGWKLLFDGKSLQGWRNYKKSTIGKGWIVDQNAIHLNAQPSKDGGWQAEDGGDIITDKPYKNFELQCDWKINNCGNSGIIFNVVEDDKYNYVWETGPEMQVLDNSCHPDARFVTHKAGDLYDLIECKVMSVKPAGEWNHARIKSLNGKIDFWLNGINVVSFRIDDNQWKKMIAGSKFKDMPDFGLSAEGHISLQDHGDKVWYKNIKIREL